MDNFSHEWNYLSIGLCITLSHGIASHSIVTCDVTHLYEFSVCEVAQQVK